MDIKALIGFANVYRRFIDIFTKFLALKIDVIEKKSHIYLD